MSSQSDKTKRLAKNTLLLYIRMIVLMGISLYTSRVILGVLGVKDYGLYNVVGGFVSMFSVISASLTTSITRFITFEMGTGNKERMNSVFYTSVNIEILLGVIVVILAETVGLWFLNHKMVIPVERIDAAFVVYQLSVITLFVNLVSIPYNASIIAHEKMSAFAYITIIEAVWKLLICFIIPFIPFDYLITYGLLMFVISILIRLLYQYYCNRNFEECKYHLHLDKVIFREMIGFAGWETIGSTAYVIRDQGGNILLNMFFGTAVNAARAVAMQVNNAIKGFVNNFMIALNPQITKSYARGEEEYFMQLINRGARFSFFLMLFISFPVLFNTEFILRVWLKEVPEHTVWFLRLVLLEVMVDTLSGTMRTAQNATGKNKIYQISIGGSNLFTIPICYILLRIGLMPESIFIASIAINLVHLILRILILDKMICCFKPMSFFRNVILRSLLVALIILIPLVILYNTLEQNFNSFLVISFTSVCISIISILLIGCTYNERMFIIKKIKAAFKMKKI